METKNNYEVFFQEGKCICCCAKDGRVMSATETTLCGNAVREISPIYKKMLSTTQTNINIESAIKKLGQYDRDIHLINKDEKKSCTKEAKLNSDVLAALCEMSTIASTLECSLLIVESQKGIYNYEQREFVQCNKESYAFWSIQNREDIVWKRNISGMFSFEYVVKYREKITQEKEWLTESLHEIGEAGYRNILFMGGASCGLYHEIIGHALEAVRAVKRECIKGDYRKKLVNYPLNVYDDVLRLGYEIGFDDEGTRKKSTQLMSDGNTKTLLTDKSHCPDGMELTGNGRRNSVFFFPETRMYRLRVQAGEQIVDELVHNIDNALVVTDIYMGNVEHETGIVQLYANVEGEIIDGKLYTKKMNILIRDNIFHFYEGVYAISNTLHFKGIHCVSGSGPLYTEAETPDTLINHIYIERTWIS